MNRIKDAQPTTTGLRRGKWNRQQASFRDCILFERSNTGHIGVNFIHIRSGYTNADYEYSSTYRHFGITGKSNNADHFDE
jgi:hypothetical protein